MATAYAFIGLDLLVLVLACLPMKWARNHPALGWLHKLFVLAHSAVLVGVVAAAVAAQRSDPAGALVVLVYLGPAFVLSAVRLAYERSVVRAPRTS
ncbi:MAG TPA: hypothetical protein VFX33_00840 [Actinomycetales bacterium]|nr:hypothetical protein [Actinomycetales bacterium]